MIYIYELYDWTSPSAAVSFVLFSHKPRYFRFVLVYWISGVSSRVIHDYTHPVLAKINLHLACSQTITTSASRLIYTSCITYIIHVYNIFSNTRVYYFKILLYLILLGLRFASRKYFVAIYRKMAFFTFI